MPPHDKMKNLDIEALYTTMRSLVRHTRALGVPCVITVSYEIAATIYTYKHNETADESEYAPKTRDKYIKESFAFGTKLYMIRNDICHNMFDRKKVNEAMDVLLRDRVIEKLYLTLFGECPDYEIFEMECYNYLDTMKLVWEGK